MSKVYRVKSISEFHKLRGLPEPEHPLISIVNYADVQLTVGGYDVSWAFDFYSVSLKRNLYGKLIYGQQSYDFDEGVMFFLSPGQVFSIVKDNSTNALRSGWMLLIHPDFLWHTSLATNIKKYEFFDYRVNEALFLSKKEEDTMMGIIQNVKEEYKNNIDKFSQNIIISQIETLLNYADRFYQRQFITRKKSNHQVLGKLEEALSKYLKSDALIQNGLPTVQMISEELNLSSSYLSNLLKVHTGLSTQQHIHEKVIEKAKEQLSTTEKSISEIAYELGFDYPQSFTKLFKSKTSISPLAFRTSFKS